MQPHQQNWYFLLITLCYFTIFGRLYNIWYYLNIIFFCNLLFLESKKMRPSVSRSKKKDIPGAQMTKQSFIIWPLLQIGTPNWHPTPLHSLPPYPILPVFLVTGFFSVVWAHLLLVFAGPVLWTDKKPGLNRTCNWLGLILNNWLQLVFDYITIFAKFSAKTA